MAKYTAYPEYKKSDVGWLKKVPKHWRKITFKYLLEVMVDNRGRTPPTYDVGIPLLEAKQIDGSLKYTSTSFDKFIDEAGHSGFIRDDVKENDILFITVGTIGKTCLVPNQPNFVIAQNLVALRMIDNYSPVFMLFWLRSMAARESMLATNKDSILDSIKISDFIQSRLYIPELYEQTQIANFLDHETAQIDILVEKQQTLIQLLKEKRQAVISHAVTKGLNPDALMKDSGVEWLGEVPEHWCIQPLRYVGNCQNGINIGAEFFGSGYPFVSYGDAYRNIELPKTVEGLVQSTEKDRISYSVRRGDVIFTRTSETIEEIGLASTCLMDVKDATFAGFLIRFRPSDNLLDPEFSKYYFRSSKLRFFFVNEMNIVTRASLSQELLKKLPVLLPPIEEQKKVAKKLNEQEVIFEKLIANAFNAIQLMQERRTALISAAVTGKIDVRGWRASEESVL